MTVEREGVVNGFLRTFLADRNAGVTRDLAHYQELFPGHDELLAAEHAALCADAAPNEETEDQRHIGPYRIVRELGRGGQGTVYLAWDTRLPRQVALKVLHGAAAFGVEDRLRFRREAELSSRLDHPGICTVYEAGEADGLAYLAMRYVEGETLASRIEGLRRRGQPDPSDLDAALAIVEQMARAVHAAHQIGIVHRDIKPSNVLLGEGARPVLTDFGTARDLDGQTLTLSGDVVGTPAYLSPEQVAGRARRFDWRIDIYALGVTLYESVTLRLPFEAASRESLYQRILSADPPDPRVTAPHVSRDLVAILETCLDKNPERRYATALDLAEDVARLRRGEPVSVEPISFLGRVARRARRRPVQAALVGALVLAALAATLLFFSRDGLRVALERETNNARLLLPSQELEDLKREADALWPPSAERARPYQDWLARAEQLVAGLDSDPGSGRIGHRERLARLRALAKKPEGENGDEAGCRAHPLYPEYALLRAQLAAEARAEGVRQGAAAPGTYEWAPDEKLPGTVAGMTTLAFDLIHHDPDSLPRALAIAQLAYERSKSDQERAQAASVEAVALSRLGRIGEARVASARSLAVAPEDVRKVYEDAARKLEWYLARFSNGEYEVGRRLGLERLASLEREIQSGRWEFEAEQDRWWHTQLTRLIPEIEAFADGQSGLVEGVSREHSWGIARRLEHARSVRQRSLESEVARRLWDEACREVAADARYAGFALRPIEGLLPLGPDPASGLWEFADLLTGDPPQRGSDGSLVLPDEFGIVFVLLPGGSFFMGAQCEDEHRPNFTPLAASDEGPVHEVRISPFFLSKYEMTQAQWLRMTKDNPSSQSPANWEPTFSKKPMGFRNPVEGVSWEDARSLLARLGFRLPTEAEWEYAARAGRGSAWFTGADEASLQGFANLSDAWRAGPGAGTGDAVPWNDEWGNHAPVGSFAANPFGLHDVVGNVGEWCYDSYQSVYVRVLVEASCVDPFVDPIKGSNMIVRGGSYRSGSREARSAYRGVGKKRLGYEHIGVRPARAAD